MSNQFYNMYLEQTISLVDTLVIKSEVAAMKINEGVEHLGYPVASNPKLWKYYLNLNGQYHATDEIMTVVSTDTLETIDFTKENLEIHRATARAYAYNTDYYKNLVARYPTQEMLILGILNPIDLDSAITSYDGKILYFDKALVEQQETSLIPRIQDYIDAYYKRWSVKGYIKTDEYYPAAMHGILVVNLVLEIMNIRTELCKTNETHSFHMTRYLTSHVGMDQYLPWFTLKQTLFFYRNIKNILNNAGQAKTFKLLLQKVLTDRRIPLASYDLEHDVEFLLSDLEPDVVFERATMNDVAADGSENVRRVADVIRKQNPLAKSNAEFGDMAIVETTDKFKRSVRNTLHTKLLESSMLDTSENVPITISDILVNHWIYLAANNRYLSQINVMDPITGVRFGISVKDAVPLYFYAMSKTFGFELEKVPYLTGLRIRKPVLPTKDELMSLTGNDRRLEPTVTTMMEYHPPMGLYISVDAYVRFCNSVFENQNRHRLIAAHGERMFDRAALEQVNHMHYMDVQCHFDTDRPYDQWLSERNIDVSEYSDADFELLAMSILNEATGAELGSVNVTLGDIQAAMLSVMRHLSSYSVQYLPNISILSNRLIDFPALRLNQWITKRSLTRQYELPRLVNGRYTGRLKITMNKRGRTVRLFRTKDEIVPEHYGLNLRYNLKRSGSETSKVAFHMGRHKYDDPTAQTCNED